MGAHVAVFAQLTGSSVYTIRVANGAATVTPDHAENADLVITQSSETWKKTFRGIQKLEETLAPFSELTPSMAVATGLALRRPGDKFA